MPRPKAKESATAKPVAGTQPRRTRARIGAVIAPLAVLAGILVGWRATVYLDSHISDSYPHYGNEPFTVHLRAGQTTVYGSSTLPHLRITGPNGSPVALTASTGSWLWTHPNGQPHSFAAFTAPTTGTYTVQTTDPDSTELVLYQPTPSTGKTIAGAVAGLAVALPSLLIAFALITAAPRPHRSPLPAPAPIGR